MARKFEDGVESVGYIKGLSDEEDAACLKLDARGASVTLPQRGPTGDLVRALVNKDARSVPGSLRFHSSNGSYVLADCRSAGSPVSSLGASISQIRATRVVEAAGSESTYAEVDGMKSEIDGLSSWSGMSTVTQTFDPEPTVLTLRAEHQDDICLGGSGNAAITSSFTLDPHPRGNVFGITDLAKLRTQSSSPWPWQEHAAVHHMVQDLMSLVFGRPCLSRIASIKREDEQPYTTDGDPRRIWREVYEPTFGRSLDGVEPLDRATASPLFYLSDVDRTALENWIDKWWLWSRPTWIAVTTMFQNGTTVESHLLQIGVALEALGYALWHEQTGGEGKAPKYPQLLKRVTDATNMQDHPKIYGGQSVGAWRQSFNETFKGAKHADNPLPDPDVAGQYARQGLNLIRAWIGTHLGVPEHRLTERFNHQ